MKTVQTLQFTTSYEPKISTMVIAVKGSDETTALVRLTPTILEPLVGKLCEWLHETVEPVKSSKEQKSTPQHSSALNSMEQTAARIDKASKKSEPVRLTVKRMDLTPSRIVIKFKKGGIELHMEDSDAQATIIMPLLKQSARQWLDILYKHWIKAGWPTDIWPYWIKTDSLPAKGTIH